ncbi:hypothetical protein BOX15_Mlig007248g3 [Macrostomum lignano]|uniref:PCI domain-containing protein n=2 Tax=Macrostomum lignano TaxID=282301 RepID=A0A1I8JIN2_9PLAT|nr:hypothetical protein BOX15_Mlig007248g2 [Macrostomum lignano]PAA66387.1 hypothetical protein BOX15_Mlig007248g1 [Macrostomum lignano]PAA75122.1 hypothetical protein BOX15_Mlig007248g3 [Macrostomum lignano]
MAVGAVETLVSSLASAADQTSEEASRRQETEILTLGRRLFDSGEAQQLADLIVATRPFLNRMSKAKAGKLVKTLLDHFLDLEAGTGREIKLCEDCIAWADAEKRNYLRQSLQVRLMALFYSSGRYEEALRLGSKLLRELKKLDDKMLLVEVQLLESKTYYKLSNVQRARAALTSSRTTANGIYIPPKMQAGLDLQSGVLHAADERDFKTAYSYFYEAFEGYDSVDLQRQAVNALKYMLMCKIILNQSEEVSSILSGKLALKYAAYSDVQAMTEIAGSVKRRSLADFVAARDKFKAELDDDFVVKRHLATLYDSLVERNLSKLIEAYGCVQIDRIAELIGLPRDVVEKKLSQMILDKSLNGILDQESGVLVMYTHQEADQTYARSLDTIHESSKVIDQLYIKSGKLT